MHGARRVAAENTSGKGLWIRRVVSLLPETMVSRPGRPGNQPRVFPCRAGSRVRTFPGPYHS